MRRSLLVLLAGLSLVPSPAIADQASIDSLRLLKGATGAIAARSAVQKTVAEGAVNLLPILNAFQGATPLGANWLRSAFETIAAAESEAGASPQWSCAAEGRQVPPPNPHLTQTCVV